MKKNKFFIALRLFTTTLGIGLMAVGQVPILQATNTDIIELQGQGTLNNVGVFRVDVNGNVFVSTYTASGASQPHTTITNQGVVTHSGSLTIGAPADLYFGSASVIVTTTTTSGSSQGTIYTAFLASSSVTSASVAALEGSVLCSTVSQQNNQVTATVCPAVANLANVLGIAVVAASTGALVNVYDRGWVLALTTGTVMPGDALATSSISAGYLSTSVSTAVCAIALSTGTFNGGLTKVKIIR